MERQQQIQSSFRCYSHSGLDEFSVSATSVLKTRKTIADSSMAECKALADKVMACATEAEVQAVLAQQ